MVDDRREGARQGSGPASQRGFVERAKSRGTAATDSESVRPHLRDQLRLKALLPSPFPVPDTQPFRDDDRE